MDDLRDLPGDRERELGIEAEAVLRDVARERADAVGPRLVAAERAAQRLAQALARVLAVAGVPAEVSAAETAIPS